MLQSRPAVADHQLQNNRHTLNVQLTISVAEDHDTGMSPNPGHVLAFFKITGRPVPGGVEHHQG